MSRDNDEERVGFTSGADLDQMTTAAIKLAQQNFTNLTQTLGMMAPGGKVLPLRQFYQKSMDFAFEQIFTGAADYETAIRQATTKMADAGVRTIDYASGRSTSLEAAVRCNMMGGMGLLDEQITQVNHDALGCNGWEISAHANSAPDHEPIQGKQFSDEEFEQLNGSLARRIGTLNCGHVAMPIIIGVNSPQYTEDELSAFQRENAEGVTYEGRHMTGYEATQYQNRIERSIRTQKRRVLLSDTTGDKEQLLTDQVRLTRLNQEYRRFNAAMGFKSRAERLEVIGWGRKQAALYCKELEKYSTIHYNKNGTIVVTDDWKSKGKVTIPQKYKPNAVIETNTVYKNGTVQVDRTIYDENGLMAVQIHSGPHNRPDKHPFGKKGEHVHRYTWDDGKLIQRVSAELSDLERIQHQDILGGEEADS